ncbi:hypothetical protein B1757_05550 [Acidithiobacillus marinus]|uniref:Cyclic di-GMP receptor atypical PilZ domain-containing protein n=1 Tax=Acidithiobacillus marinus TaxID=187490 RepID=A0A2I1DMZ1_9PROT|nr:PilZ domain-containing protein [Acidithiobacillus marinus]PKY11253.1 hypothetical protein B1757_05550 [Acidithiobacillus marinus]
MSEQHAVVLEDILPLSLEKGELNSLRRSRLMRDNLALLKALLVMDDHLLAEDENREVTSSLETKIDLLLLLVGKGIQGLDPLPSAFPCALGAENLYWDAPVSEIMPESGSAVCVSLFLRPGIAMPLFLPGVLENDAKGSGAATDTLLRHHLHFQVDTRVQESLDRLIFRYHRRAIARKKDQHALSTD